jgi:hypothetical protein
MLLLSAAACGGGDDDDDAVDASSKSKDATTTTAGEDETTTTSSGATTTTAASGPGSTVKPVGGTDPGGYGWTATADIYRGLNGKQLEFGCPPAGQLGSVYGSGPYTDDSSVCSAAVHAGKITQAEGAQVVISIQPGQPSYEGTSANGVDSGDWGKYDGSYSIVSNAPFKGTSSPQTGGFGWKATAARQHGLNGQKFNYSCPPGGELLTVYGTGTYTDDSSVCTAAVHAGKITKAEGGSVVIEIKPGQKEYDASTANGVTSNAYGDWGGSFSIVG